jgi:hypothetical protein
MEKRARHGITIKKISHIVRMLLYAIRPLHILQYFYCNRSLTEGGGDGAKPKRKPLVWLSFSPSGEVSFMFDVM